MQGKNARKFRRRGGFTFAEVLVTLAILGALLAVAIPATVAMARSLKMMELDACARQIAVAVQNNITGMKSAGTLKSFGDKNSGSIGGYCISNGHAEVQKILPLGAIDPAVAGKYYTIVY
ncbi:MAG: type II secretion system protein, partial [Oscillospiraceae bacterium]